MQSVLNSACKRTWICASVIAASSLASTRSMKHNIRPFANSSTSSHRNVKSTISSQCLTTHRSKDFIVPHQMRKFNFCGVAHKNNVCTHSLFIQEREEFDVAAGKRSHEAFLSQFDPMEMLELEPDCTIEEIDEAFEKMKGKYGPNGPCKNPKLLDRVFQAYEILKDPQSPYYARAHVSQSDRQRLQFNLLPKSQRILISIQGFFLAGIALTALVLVVVLSFLPARRSLRAATR